MKVTFLEQLIHFSEHYRALRLHQLKTAGGSLFLAVGKLECAHHARGPNPHGGWVPPFAVGGCGRRAAAATHRKSGIFPSFAVGGMREEVLKLCFPHPTHPPQKGGPRTWWAHSNFPRVSNLTFLPSHLIF